MKVNVFTSIDDPELIEGWRKLETEYDLFPQSRYFWTAGWWNQLRGKQSFRGVAVTDPAGNFAGLAPLCMESQAGVRILRSVPVRFGDFYDFLIGKTQDQEAVTKTILHYLESFGQWDVVRLDRLRECSAPCRFIPKEKSWVSRISNRFFETSLQWNRWEDYLDSMEATVRRNIRARLRKLEGSGRIEFLCIDNLRDFQIVENKIRELYTSRLRATGRKAKPERELRFRNELILSGFSEQCLRLFVLKLDGTVIAYRLGFVADRCYYDWNISFDIRKKALHPGICSMAYTVRYLLEQGFRAMNLMSGIYPWKSDFSPGGHTGTVESLMCSSTRLPGLLYKSFFQHR